MKPIIGIFVVAGFTETEAENTGSDFMQRALDEQFRKDYDVEVYDLRPWKADMAGLAELAKRDGVTHAIVLGYSHGAGYGSPHLCEELAKRKISISLLLVCDPVYRPQWLPRWTIAQALAFRALIPRSAVIRLPKQVARVKGVRQRNNVPQGHQLRIGDGPAFDVTLIERKNVNHSNIDESAEWRELVAEEVFNCVSTLRSLA
jgi:hypothetical protein